MIFAERPKMPTEADQYRSTMLSARYLILTEAHDEIVDRWREDHIGDAQNAAWGPSDLSANPLAEICRQLVTPGLYGERPRPRRAQGDADALIGDEGYLVRCGYWTRMQWVQYLTLGMGDEVVLFDVALQEAGDPEQTPRAELMHELAHGYDVWVEPSEGRPDVPAALAVLRLVYHDQLSKWMYVWKRWDLPTSRRAEPALRYLKAESGGGFGEDVSNLFLRRPDGTFGAMVGEAYPFRWPSGRRKGQPFIPATIYRAVDTGNAWNHLYRRGVHHGTLNTALYYTFAGHCAHAASGSTVFIDGGTVSGASLVRQPEDGGRPSAQAPRTLGLLPGSIVEVARHEPGSPATIKEVGPGANLPNLAAWARDYSVQNASRWGLNPADVTRQHANPTSGAALAISNAEKRVQMAQCEEIFRRCDVEAIEKMAALLTLFGGEDLPVDGYSISYVPIPESPAEAAERRAQIDWEVEHGHLSIIDAYCRMNPGSTRADAISALTQATVDRAVLDLREREALLAAGLTRPTPPPAPNPNPNRPAPDADQETP